MNRAMSRIEDGTEPTHMKLSDAFKSREFDGWLLAFATTESPDFPRWTTMDLYETTDGDFVVYTVGHSVVYHDPGGSCNSGVLTEVADLPEDAEPCPKCRPPRDPQNSVNLEAPLRQLHECDTPAAVRKAVCRYDRNTQTYIASRPAQRLLSDAAAKNPAFDPANDPQ